MNPVKFFFKNWKKFLIFMIILIFLSYIASPKEELFDLDVEIPSRYKEVSPGEEVLFQLTLYNLKRIGRVDVVVEYGIEDMEGNEIVSEHTTLAVEFQVSVVRSLDVPFDVKPGNYVLFAKARYNDVVGTGSSLFKVTTKEELGMGGITTFSLIAVIFVLFLIVVILNLYKESIYVKTIKH